MIKNEKDIMESWSGDITQPLVSILCITYNHYGYISRAIESFLSQDLRSPFEVIIHDDASTDGTSDIIRAYQSQYPNIVKSIFQEENQFSKGRVVFDIAHKKAIGKYIAYCEGDDYWMDPQKIKLQCAYLENHPHISVTSHDSFSMDQEGHIITQSRLARKHHRDYSAQEMATGKAWMLNLTMVFRNIDFGDIPERGKIKNNDKFLISLLGNYGGSHFHSEIQPACHIVHPDGMWSGLDLNTRHEEQINSWYWIYRYYKRVGKDEYAYAFWIMYLRKVFSLTSRKTLSKEFLIRILRLRDINLFVKKLRWHGE
ncbi:glycosyltransferase [Halomonas ventosae]|nr:glycosyltransferase [Halomonas ventosae]